MQSDIPPLPISCLAEVRITRTHNVKERSSPHNGKSNLYSSNKYAPSLAQPNKKKLRPVIGGTSPYKNSARLYQQFDNPKCISKNIVDQRVCSAKMLKIKQLQNQLADAHYHLNELSNENKLLKVIQKRQDAALKKYEGSNAELPRIINTHHEDFRVLDTKFKKLKAQHKETCNLLKEKENELHVLQAQNKKLLQLSKDRNLGEREKLQIQVSDLNHTINQQDEVIQTLKRKLSLETKYLKHQLHVEMVKHKETQKLFKDNEAKLRNLEALMELREKRSRHANQVTLSNKSKVTVTSQSMVNLNEGKQENTVKLQPQRKRPNEVPSGSFPALSNSKSSIKNQTRRNMQEVHSENSMNEHSRNIQKSSVPRNTAFTTSVGSLRDSPIQESLFEELIDTQRQIDSTVNFDDEEYELPNELKPEFTRKKLDSGDHNIKNSLPSNTFNFTNTSRLLHSRLISSASEKKITDESESKKIRSQSLTNDDLESNNKNDHLKLYDRDSVVTVIEKNSLKDTNFNPSNRNSVSISDSESEIEVPMDLNPHEDKNIFRKSDVTIPNWEPELFSNVTPFSSKLSTPNLPIDSVKNSSENMNSDKNSKTSKTDLFNEDLIKDNIDNSIEKLVEEKKSTRKRNDLEKFSGNSLIANQLKKEKNLEINKEKMSNTEQKINEDNMESLLDYAIQSLEDIEKLQRDEQNSNSLNHSEDNSTEFNYQKPVESKPINESSKSFDKAKLLAAMKAIDDNENIEFIDQKSRRNSGNKLQITENLFKGKPSHPRKKSSIINELFSNN